MTDESPSARRVAVAAFLVGLASLTYEVYGAKVLFLYLVETTHAVAILLSAFLAGLALSSLLVARYAGRWKPETVLIALQVAATAYALLILQRHQLIPMVFDAVVGTLGHGRGAQTANLSFAWVYLFFPGLFMGGAFPLLTDLYGAAEETTVERVGLVYFWDTSGAIAGALVCGFVLLPWLGLEWAIVVPALVNLLVIGLVVRRRRSQLAVLAIAIATAAAQWRFAAPIGSTTLPELPELTYPYAGSGKRFGQVVEQRASAFGFITIGDDALGVPGNRALFVNYRDMCQTADTQSEATLAERALIGVRSGARVLNIGLGCGFTAATAAGLEEVARVDVAEINPTVVDLSKRHFREATSGRLDGPKVSITIRDGAELLRHTRQTYAAIIIDIEEPSVVHSSPLFTREYAARAKRRLEPGGVFALWIFGTKPDPGKVLFNTLLSEFAHVELRIGGQNLQLFASDSPLAIPEGTALEQRIVDRILASEVTLINTIDNRALERFFDVRAAFGFPQSYSERRWREPPNEPL